ncbi:MAG: glycosyltransferase [Turicibacter sp.]|nr:glycosyltransferase [Turicibacter sp.]
MDKKHPLSLCMIVKNEANCLSRCLESMKVIADEIVIIDTGSTDETIKIAKTYGAIIKTYEWNNNFAEARNFALSFATKEWILVLDADEYLRDEDEALFLELLSNENVDSYYIKTLNFTEPNNINSCIVNLNHRLFRNHKGFHYVGAIHEQLISNQSVVSKISNLGFYHTGYLKEVVKAKNKPKRNGKILEEILKQEPDNTFHQFNLANEMFQLGKYDEAIQLYNQAYEHTSPQQGYMPKLIVFRINALVANGEDKKALAAANEGIALYPTFTHLMFLKGTLEEKFGLITKAIRSYESCLELGSPDSQLEFSKASEALWPHLKLAVLYDGYGDYEKAIFHYNKYLELNPSHYQLLYMIAPCLKKLNADPEQLTIQLAKYLPPRHLNNQILLIDLLLKQGLFQQAKRYLDEIDLSESNAQICYLRGKNGFYLEHYENCQYWFEQYMKQERFETVAPYYYLMYLLTRDETYSPNQRQYPKEYLNLQMYLENKAQIKLSQGEINLILRLIEECLIIDKQELVKQLEAILISEANKVTNRQLAQLYCQHDHPTWAKTMIEEYILSGGKIDTEMMNLLNRIKINQWNE